MTALHSTSPYSQFRNVEIQGESARHIVARRAHWSRLAHSHLSDRKHVLVATARARASKARGREKISRFASRRHEDWFPRRFSVVIVIDEEVVIVVRALVTAFAGSRAASERAAGADPLVRAGLTLESELSGAGADAATDATRQRRKWQTPTDFAIHAGNVVHVDLLVRVLCRGGGNTGSSTGLVV